MDFFLAEALAEAEESLAAGGIPIGAVLVRDGRVIGRGHNRRVQADDPLAHAEIDCLRHAGRIGYYRDTVLYSTLMPCYLCAGAAVQFRVPKVVVGEAVNFAGARDFMISHGIEMVNLADDTCTALMSRFIADYPELWHEDIGTL